MFSQKHIKDEYEQGGYCLVSNKEEHACKEKGDEGEGYKEGDSREKDENTDTSTPRVKSRP